jgi:hypothetical protein
MSLRSSSLLALCSILCLGLSMRGGEEPARKAKVNFNRDIRPLLAKNCFACHGADDKKRGGGLRLDQRDVAIAPRKKHPAAIVPQHPEKSLLLERITSDDDAERMPPPETGNKLTEAEVKLLREWIAQGAEYEPHWAFVKPSKPALPVTKQLNWAKQPLDHFVLAELERHRLMPSPESDRYSLFRRLSLDLRGLPPTLAELEAWEKDAAPDAYACWVDRFLADPAFGERWARVWLDLARYADSAGYGSDPLRMNMWRYRDWVIDAFNHNLPYDQFTIEQLGGDLLPQAGMQQKMATAFHRNTMTNTEGGTDDEEFRVAAVKDRINTTMQVWMGLTMGCAQCHSHKYDPISQTEYYQGFAIFNQTADNDQPNEAPTMPAPTVAQLNRNKELDKLIAVQEAKLQKPSLELAIGQSRWEAGLRSTGFWHTIPPVRTKSDSGRWFHTQPDHSIRASTPRPKQDTYQVTLQPAAGSYTGLRVEVFPSHLSTADRNFVLSQLAVRVKQPNVQPPLAHYVRISLPGANLILSLAEVEIYSQGENVARQGEASQSSIDFVGHAARALDGNTNGDYFASNTVTHTRTEADPWWEVKLPGLHAIDRIVIWNRTGGVENRLNGAVVELLDFAHEPIWKQTLTTAPQPSVELATVGKTLTLTQAVADYSQARFDVATLLKPKKNSGWAVGGSLEKPHQAQLVFQEPLKLSGNETLEVTLSQQFNMPKLVLDHFRLSLSTDPKLAMRAAVPADILTIVDIPAEARAGFEAAALAKHYRTLAPELKPVREEITRLQKSRPTISALPVMQELPASQRRVTKLLNKGNFLDPGALVEARLPALFQPQGTPTSNVSRLDLARWLMHPDNPLTARVAVNRLWSQLFGTGLVETEEDFGIQGDLPSHPELLDHLAHLYQHELQWNTKALIKTLVMSATYRQSSRVTTELLEKDPRNRLFSRGPRYRLEAEMVRDQALALSGLLSRKIGGPSVYPKQPDGLWQAAFNGERTWMTSRGEDKYRRGLYTFWRRTIPYPSMAAFDAPSRELCQIKRVRSNTPVQAFVTLNDPVYLEAAQALARRIVKEGGTSTDARLRYALRLVLSRPPTEQQLATLTALYQREKERLAKNPADAIRLATEPYGPLPKEMDAVELATWTVIANVLLNLDGVLMKG